MTDPQTTSVGQWVMPATLGVLLATLLVWFLLAVLAGLTDGASGVPATGDFDKATAWFKDLLAVAGLLAGFLGISASSTLVGPRAAFRAAETGTFGVLAGATLLEVGGWGVPVALAALVGMTGVARVMEARR